MGFLTAIADLLQGFVAWLWNLLAPPDRKTWCAAFYFVAQEDATLAYPEDHLDQKISDLVAAVEAAAAAVPDVHVVYRTVPADPVESDPVAKVVRFLGPKTGTVFFPDCYEPSTWSLLDTGLDLTCFLRWVYRWCPADHYAIFIWGHSFGPAGLFEPGSGLNIPKPGLTALKEAFLQFNAMRTHSDPPLPDRPSKELIHSDIGGGGATASTSAPTGEEAVQEWAASGDKKVDVVLFHDCWMSTIETAFEIADSTARMIASQSLIPIGTKYANFMWPYEDLLKALAAPSYTEDMTNLIAQFYVNHYAQVQYLTTIPVTLLDLSNVPQVKAPLSLLVSKLAALPPVERKPLIEPARLVRLDMTNPYHPVLLAGDGALVDMLKLCAALKTTQWPAQGTAAEQAAAQQAVADVAAELAKLVKVNREAHASYTADVGFQGLSAFHWPPVGADTDDFITEAVRRSESVYRSLQFVQQTGWHKLGLEHKPE